MFSVNADVYWIYEAKFTITKVLNMDLFYKHLDKEPFQGRVWTCSNIWEYLYA